MRNKKSGNVKHRPLNMRIFKDLLGDDGDLAMKAVPKSHERRKYIEKCTIDMIKVAVLAMTKNGKEKEIV